MYVDGQTLSAFSLFHNSRSSKWQQQQQQQQQHPTLPAIKHVFMFICICLLLHRVFDSALNSNNHANETKRNEIGKE